MKCGRKFCFHGSFGTKVGAQAKERKVKGFIRKITVKGHTRFLVLTGKAISRR